MSEISYNNKSKAIRFSQTVLGAIAVVLSIAIITIPGAGIASLIFLLSFTIFALGFERIAAGILPYSKRSSRITNVILGALAVGLGFAVIAFPVFATIFLVSLLSVGLLFLGVARIIQGVESRNISKWSRALVIGVGILSLVISFIVLAHPISGIILLTLILAVNLLIIGVECIVNGISRKKNIVATTTH